MKVVLVSHTPAIGGAELVLLETARGLRDRGIQVDVILPGRGRLSERFEAIGIPTWLVQFERWAVIRRSWTAVGRRMRRNVLATHAIRRLLLRLGPDVVVTNTLTIPAAALASKSLGVPHVWYLHEFGQRDHGFTFDLGAANTMRLIDWLSTCVIVNSHAVYEEFAKRIPARKLHVVYCAVDVEDRPHDAPAAPDEPLRLVLVGNMRPSKGQEDAIRALACLQERGGVRLTLVGYCGQRYLRALHELASRLGVCQAVDFVDFTEDCQAYFARSHVALMCSRAEAFGRVTVEAMKFGLPVIGANSGGTRELVRDGWNGLLYPVGDACQLAERIHRLSRDPGLRARLGRNAQEWARGTFSRARHTDDVLRVLTLIAPTLDAQLPEVEQSTSPFTSRAIDRDPSPWTRSSERRAH